MTFLNNCENKLKTAQGLLHITTSLDKILQSGELKPSAGGLGGVVYGVPLFSNGEIHNLGKYLIEEEMPMFLKKQGRSVRLKFIEIEPKGKIKIGTVDYLNWGKNYFELYQNKKFDTKTLTNKISREQNRIKEIMLSSNTQRISDLLLESNVLKMIYFETVLEILFSTQTPNPTNELMNSQVKNFIFLKNPKMVGKFSLSNFTVTIDELKDCINTQTLIVKLRTNLIKYLANEKNLAGHILFRDLGLRTVLEKNFAEKLWAEANDKGINVLTYPIPKGEMGILPVDKFNFYESKIENGRSYKLRKLNLKITKELVTKETILRNPYTNNGRSL